MAAVIAESQHLHAGMDGALIARGWGQDKPKAAKQVQARVGPSGSKPAWDKPETLRQGDFEVFKLTLLSAARNFEWPTRETLVW